jgi:hypothetical protein
MADMTLPTWPFSWPSPPGWEPTELDEAAAIIAQAPRQPRRLWGIKSYRTQAAGIYGEVMVVDGDWYATVIVRARGLLPSDVRTLGVYGSRGDAMDAVDAVLDEYEATP